MEKMMNEKAANKFDRTMAAIHDALGRDDLHEVMRLVSSVETNMDLDNIIQAFLLKYQYNFKTRFFEKAEFDQCLLFSNVLNRRVVVN
ncbi:MAG: hypothetical protein ACFCUU_15095 [Cyclobacteriaceae bacterium]